MIVHKGRVHPGRHQAIIDADLFEAVQARLDANTRRRASNREQKVNAPLAGRLFDADGQPMSPTFSYGRGGKLYRYYVSAPLQQGARRDPSDTAIRRISAPPLEANLAAVLRRVIPGCPDDPITLVSRAELHDRTLHCLLPIDRIVAIRERLEPHERVEPDPVDASLARLHLPLVRRRGETWVLKGPSAGNRPDPVLVRALRSAHAMLHQDDAGLPVLVTAPDTPYRRRLVRLAFLAPEIQRAIVEGRQSACLTLTRLLKAQYRSTGRSKPPASRLRHRRNRDQYPHPAHSTTGKTALIIPCSLYSFPCSLDLIPCYQLFFSLFRKRTGKVHKPLILRVTLGSLVRKTAVFSLF